MTESMRPLGLPEGHWRQRTRGVQVVSHSRAKSRIRQRGDKPVRVSIAKRYLEVQRLRERYARAWLKAKYDAAGTAVPAE